MPEINEYKEIIWIKWAVLHIDSEVYIHKNDAKEIKGTFVIFSENWALPCQQVEALQQMPQGQWQHIFYKRCLKYS